VKLVEMWKSELKDKSGIKEHRIFVINVGPGENEMAAIEVWFVPIGAGLPDPTAAEIEDPADPLD